MVAGNCCQVGKRHCSMNVIQLSLRGCGHTLELPAELPPEVLLRLST